MATSVARSSAELVNDAFRVSAWSPFSARFSFASVRSWIARSGRFVPLTVFVVVGFGVVVSVE